MITNINKLKSFGIFQDYKSDKSLHSFEQYNLFYGWNGSGKSTLTKLFFSLNDKKTHEHFSDGEYSIISKNCPEITHKNISSNDLNIRVFNKDFIERNVNFEQSKANSILILSEEKKEEMDLYKTLLDERAKRTQSHAILESAYNKSVENLKKNLSKWASNIKKSFELIETSNTYYLNYNVTKLTSFIRDNNQHISKDSILSVDDVKDLRSAIKPERKQDIALERFSLIQTEILINKAIELEGLLSKSIFSNQIQRLVLHPNLNTWVKDGLALYDDLESNNCEFCGQNMPMERITQLNNHFSEEYRILLSDLNELDLYIHSVIEYLNLTFPEPHELYEEFQSEYILAKKNYLDSIGICLKKLEEMLKQLEKKVANPFEIISYRFTDTKSIFDDLNVCIETMFRTASKHNLKNSSFDDIVKEAQHLLELHFISQILITENYWQTEKKIKGDKIDLDVEKSFLDQTIIQIQVSEAILLNEAVGAEAFNGSLAKFLGRSDISLKFDTGLKGYKLVRGKTTAPAKNLSEGERTAIAFVYFISKLRENGNQIEKTIVVVDDPISSFDSNHLFHSYSFLKLGCEKAEQLFILTHNFQYFKLIRDWLIKKNERKRQPDSSYIEKIRARFYSIECTNDDNRHAKIVNSNDTLIKFNSEYHYVFFKLHSLRGLESLDIEKAFLISNLSRRLLESFLTFKFPKGRNDFNMLLKEACKDDETCEAVYRFINKYSHDKQIEFHDTPIDNLLGEGNNIIEEVFKIINELDNNHYKEMNELVAL